MRRLILVLAILVGLFFLYGGGKTPKTTPTQEKEIVKVTDEESVVIDIVERVSPSVVTVGIEQKIIQIDPSDPLGLFRIPRRQGETRDEDIGSGFIVSSDGLIVTNKHVVSTQGKYKVIVSDGAKYDVTRIYRDPVNDMAILKIDPTAASGQVLQPVEMGNSDNLKVGQLVIAMGTPLGEFRGSVTQGIISGLGRGIEAGSAFEEIAEELDNVIQTDAAINPGNSGGPLVNSSGQVIGVNTAIALGAENIGFAIPINVIKDALDNFNNTGGFSRPYLGVAYIMVTKQMATVNEIPEGAFVDSVVKGGAAEKAGVKADDVIIKIDGEALNEENTLAKIIAKKKVGQEIKLTVWRDGKELEFTTTLLETPEE